MNPTTTAPRESSREVAATGTATPPAADEPPDAFFLDVVRDMARGKALGKLSVALREVAEACRSTGKDGQLRVTLLIKPNSKNEAVTCEVEYACVKKIPERAEPSSTFFMDEGGNLTRRDPRQRDFEFRPRPMVGGLPAPGAEAVSEAAVAQIQVKA